MKLLLATGNRKKIAELARLLEPLSMEVVTPDDIGGLNDVDEDQDTFAGNARKKAVAAARATGLWSLADDSGLEVDALDGAPGVTSARFAGRHGDDDANNRLLLEKLSGVSESERGARFTCVLALAAPDGEIVGECTGHAHGRILNEPRGTRDFGYDPLFVFTEQGHEQTGRSFAELDAVEKSSVSHRGRALAELAQRLPQWTSKHSS